MIIRIQFEYLINCDEVDLLSIINKAKEQKTFVDIIDDDKKRVKKLLKKHPELYNYDFVKEYHYLYDFELLLIYLKEFRPEFIEKYKLILKGICFL